MSKFLYFQDGHCKAKNSVNRLGNYFDDWLKKFDELLFMAKKFEVDAILDGGDLLDSAEPSYRILDEIADRVEKTGIPIYSLFGNHAQRYASNEHSKYTGLAHLQKRSELFKYLGTKFQADKAIIHGIEYSYEIEEDLKKDGIKINPKYKDFWNIVIVHGFITPKPFLPQVSHVCCDDIKTNADIVLVAHYHNQWEKKVGDTLFKDIGCFGRNSITESKINPGFILLDTDKRTCEFFELTSAKSGKEIFNLDKLQEIKKFDKNIEDFIKSIESAEFQSTNIRDIVKQIGKDTKVDQEVIDLILNKIGEINV